MAAPPTVSATGYFVATRAGAVVGEATLRMRSARRARSRWVRRSGTITGDPATKTFRGTGARLGGRPEDRQSRSLLKGTVDGDPLELTRAVLRPIPATRRWRSPTPGPTGP